MGTLFVSSKDEVVKALDVWNDGILNSNCFIGTVQYFDPSEVVEQLDHADAASERGSQAQAKSMPAEHEDKPSAGSTRDAELGWHLGDDGPLTRFIVCTAKAMDVARRSVADSEEEQEEPAFAPTLVEEVLDVGTFGFCAC